MAHEGGSRLSLAREERQDIGGQAGLAQGPHDLQGAPGRLLRGLEHRRVARGQRAGRHAARDGQREVPRGDHRGDAAGRVAHLVALAGHLEKLAPALQLHRRAGVVLEEVDRLAHVGVGLGPRLRALAHREGGQRQTPLAQPRGGADQHLRALVRGTRAPRPGAARRRLHGPVDLLLGGERGRRDGAVRPARIGGHELLAVATLVADPHRHAQRQARVQPRQRLAELRSHGGPAQLEHGLVAKRVHGAARRRSRSSPPLYSCRNDSFAVFSSSRRTR